MLFPLTIAAILGGLAWKAATSKPKPKKLARGFTVVETDGGKAIRVDDVKLAWRWAVAKCKGLSPKASAEDALGRIEKALGFVPTGLAIPLLGDEEWSDLRSGARMLGSWSQLKKLGSQFAAQVTGSDKPHEPPPPTGAEVLRVPVQIEVIDAGGYAAVRFVGDPHEVAIMVAAVSLPVDLDVSLTGLGHALPIGKVTKLSFGKVSWAAGAAELLGKTDLDVSLRVSAGSTDIAAVELEINYRVDAGPYSQGGSERLRIFVAQRPS